MVTNWPVKRTGTAYKDGKLFLFRTAPGDGGLIQVIRPCPDPAAWIKDVSSDRQFRGWRPEIDLSNINFNRGNEVYEGGPEHIMAPLIKVLKVFDIQDEVERQNKLQEWATQRPKPEPPWHRKWRLAFAPVPVNVRALVTKFSRTVQWNIFSSCVREPALLDMQDNFGLLLLHAHIHLIRQPKPTNPMRSLRRLIRRPRKEQVGFYGFPERNQIVRIFQKIPPDSLIRGTLMPLSQAILKDYDSVVKVLSHLPSIHYGIAQIIGDKELFHAVTPVFLEEFSERLSGYDAMNRRPADNLKDSLVMADQLQIKIPRINSLYELDLLHDELVEETNKVAALKMTLPDPPRIGLENFIRPLRTSEAIYKHARRQGNCCASYIPRVNAKSCYLYSYVIKHGDFEEEGTLSLIKRGRSWSLGEVSSRFNRRPSEVAFQFVKQWHTNKHFDAETFLEVHIAKKVNQVDNKRIIDENVLANNEIERGEEEEYLSQLNLPF